MFEHVRPNIGPTLGLYRPHTCANNFMRSKLPIRPTEIRKTFMGLRWRLRVVYIRASPCRKAVLVQSKSVPGGFSVFLRTNKSKVCTTVTLDSISHTRTEVRECFKGDEASQSKRPKFDLSPHQNHLRDFAVLLGWLVFCSFLGFFNKATAYTHGWIFTQNTSNDVVPGKEVPFGGPDDYVLYLDP